MPSDHVERTLLSAAFDFDLRAGVPSQRVPILLAAFCEGGDVDFSAHVGTAALGCAAVRVYRTAGSFAPPGLALLFRSSPTAYAVGCNLPLLRSFFHANWRLGGGWDRPLRSASWMRNRVQPRCGPILLVRLDSRGRLSLHGLFSHGPQRGANPATQAPDKLLDAVGCSDPSCTLTCCYNFPFAWRANGRACAMAVPGFPRIP